MCILCSIDKWFAPALFADAVADTLIYTAVTRTNVLTNNIAQFYTVDHNNRFGQATYKQEERERWL